MTTANRATDELVKIWYNLQAEYEDKERRLRVLKGELLQAENALGKHLAPDDVRDFEKIGIWCRLNDSKYFGEKLVVVTAIPLPKDKQEDRYKGQQHRYTIELRDRANTVTLDPVLDPDQKYLDTTNNNTPDLNDLSKIKTV